MTQSHARARASGRSAKSYKARQAFRPAKKIWPQGSGMVSLYVGITDYDWFRLLFL